MTLHNTLYATFFFCFHQSRSIYSDLREMTSVEALISDIAGSVANQACIDGFTKPACAEDPSADSTKPILKNHENWLRSALYYTMKYLTDPSFEVEHSNDIRVTLSNYYSEDMNATLSRGKTFSELILDAMSRLAIHPEACEPITASYDGHLRTFIAVYQHNMCPMFYPPFMKMLAALCCSQRMGESLMGTIFSSRSMTMTQPIGHTTTVTTQTIATLLAALTQPSGQAWSKQTVDSVASTVRFLTALCRFPATRDALHVSRPVPGGINIPVLITSTLSAGVPTEVKTELVLLARNALKPTPHGEHPAQDPAAIAARVLVGLIPRQGGQGREVLEEETVAARLELNIAICEAAAELLPMLVAADNGAMGGRNSGRGRPGTQPATPAAAVGPIVAFIAGCIPRIATPGLIWPSEDVRLRWMIQTSLALTVAVDLGKLTRESASVVRANLEHLASLLQTTMQTAVMSAGPAPPAPTPAAGQFGQPAPQPAPARPNPPTPLCLFAVRAVMVLLERLDAVHSRPAAGTPMIDIGRAMCDLSPVKDVLPAAAFFIVESAPVPPALKWDITIDEERSLAQAAGRVIAAAAVHRDAHTALATGQMSLTSLSRLRQSLSDAAEGGADTLIRALLPRAAHTPPPLGGWILGIDGDWAGLTLIVDLLEREASGHPTPAPPGKSAGSTLAPAMWGVVRGVVRVAGLTSTHPNRATPPMPPALARKIVDTAVAQLERSAAIIDGDEEKQDVLEAAYGAAAATMHTMAEIIFKHTRLQANANAMQNALNTPAPMRTTVQELDNTFDPLTEDVLAALGRVTTLVFMNRPSFITEELAGSIYSVISLQTSLDRLDLSTLLQIIRRTLEVISSGYGSDLVGILSVAPAALTTIVTHAASRPVDHAALLPVTMVYDIYCIMFSILAGDRSRPPHVINAVLTSIISITVYLVQAGAVTMESPATAVDIAAVIGRSLASAPAALPRMLALAVDGAQTTRLLAVKAATATIQGTGTDAVYGLIASHVGAIPRLVLGLATTQAPKDPIIGQTVLDLIAFMTTLVAHAGPEVAAALAQDPASGILTLFRTGAGITRKLSAIPAEEPSGTLSHVVVGADWPFLLLLRSAELLAASLAAMSSQDINGACVDAAIPLFNTHRCWTAMLTIDTPARAVAYPIVSALCSILTSIANSGNLKSTSTSDEFIVFIDQFADLIGHCTNELSGTPTPEAADATAHLLSLLLTAVFALTPVLPAPIVAAVHACLTSLISRAVVSPALPQTVFICIEASLAISWSVRDAYPVSAVKGALGQLRVWADQQVAADGDLAAPLAVVSGILGRLEC